MPATEFKSLHNVIDFRRAYGPVVVRCDIPSDIRIDIVATVRHSIQQPVRSTTPAGFNEMLWVVRHAIKRELRPPHSLYTELPQPSMSFRSFLIRRTEL